MIGIALQFITGGFSRALSWATANATRMLAIALALALAWGAIERHGKHKAQKVLASTEQAYRNAQADAAKARAERDARLVATNEAINKGSTNDNAKGLSAARSAVADYARMHQCPKGGPGHTDSAAVSDRAEMASGTSGETDLAAITVADLDALAAGTVRAESCRAWGQSLIDAGLAEVGD